MEAIHRRLLAWFDAHKRDLPWRGVGDPYAVWISEVMLQQTRAGSVAPYYRRWMKRFPDIDALADANLEEVLRLWRGLGFYARARNARRCAQRLRDAFGGAFPRSAKRLGTLPGIGPYTAAAVASIAFGEAVPAVDGNVRRVVARLFDLAQPSPAQARDLSAGLMDATRPGDFNEAMMELGATVCTPRSPSCPACPLAADCRARAAGTVPQRPLTRRRGPVPSRTWRVLVAVSPRGRTLVVRRPPEGLLGGMWEFPAVEVGDGGRGGAVARAGDGGRGGGGGGVDEEVRAGTGDGGEAVDEEARAGTVDGVDGVDETTRARTVDGGDGVGAPVARTMDKGRVARWAWIVDGGMDGGGGRVDEKALAGTGDGGDGGDETVRAGTVDGGDEPARTGTVDGGDGGDEEARASAAGGTGRATAPLAAPTWPLRVREPAAEVVAEPPPVTHRFSHFTAVYRPHRVEVAEEWEEAGGRWVTPSELADLALPVAQQRIARAAGL